MSYLTSTLRFRPVCRFNNPTRKRGTGVIQLLTRRVVISTLILRTTLNQEPVNSGVLLYCLLELVVTRLAVGRLLEFVDCTFAAEHQFGGAHHCRAGLHLERSLITLLGLSLYQVDIEIQQLPLVFVGPLALKDLFVQSVFVSNLHHFLNRLFLSSIVIERHRATATNNGCNQGTNY